MRSMNLESLKNATIRTDIGQCQSFCQTSKYFGVKGEGDETTCYCINKLDLKSLGPCGAPQTSQEFAFGAWNKLSVYQIATQAASRSLKEKSDWDSDDKNCFCFSEPVKHIYKWEPCRTNYIYLCDYGGSETSQVSSYRWWKFAAEHCLSNNGSLSADFTDIHLDSAVKTQVWTSYIKASVITANTDDSDSVYRKYGYIEKKRNDQYELKFDTENKKYISLCSNEGNNAGVSSTEGPNFNTEGNSEKVIQNEDNGSSNVGMYIGITIGVLVVLVAIVLGILFWRNRKRDTKSKSADNNFHQNTGFSKCDKTNSSELRPNSAEDYHEIDDINRSSLDDYDTIKEANTAPTNNGVSNRGYIAYTLAKKGDIKKSNDYDYAKEPGTVEPVVQHNYHVLDKSPHPSTLMLERENEK